MVVAKKKSKAAVSAQPDTPRIVGDVVRTPMGKVQPNGWNPNTMTEFMRASLKRGLETDGWLSSQALLIWGKDEKGKARNLIIDGEHRWLVAGELGFTEAPMVFLSGLTEAQAKALTVKMNQKRGTWNEDELATLIRGIQFDIGGTELALDLGLPFDQLMPMLAEPAINLGLEEEPARSPEGATTGMPSSNTRMVQLFFDADQHGEFTEVVRQLAVKYGTKTVTDTTLEAIRRASRAASDAG